jgi:adenosine kinase
LAIYITGSLAYDRIMNFSGSFSDFIIPEKIHRLNVTFPIGHIEEKRGGTGGNIAYNLALLGEPSRLLACVGRDFASYRRFLERIGVDLSGVRVVTEELTAGAYITTDRHANQITGFHGAAMSLPCEYAFPPLDPALDIAILSPTNPDDLARHAQVYRQNGVRFIFDPGQQLTTFSRAGLRSCLDGAMLLVTNDYELALLMQISGLDLDGVLELTPAVITPSAKKARASCGAAARPARCRPCAPAVWKTPPAPATPIGPACSKASWPGLLWRKPA